MDKLEFMENEWKNYEQYLEIGNSQYVTNLRFLLGGKKFEQRWTSRKDWRIDETVCWWRSRQSYIGTKDDGINSIISER